MEHNNFFSETYNNLLQQEQIYKDLDTFNKERNSNDDLILHLNIRSLNANFEKLLILIKSIKKKPFVIVCTEVWKLDYHEYYNIKDYKMYYNFGAINKNDGIVIYIKENIIHTTETIEIGRLKLLNTNITLSNNKYLEITSLYTSHDLSCAEFNLNLKNYLHQKNNSKNHIIIGNFNININDYNSISNDFINNLLEKGLLPSFTSFTKTTRPSNNYTYEGSCIDNIFIKTDSINTKALKLWSA